jgi:hypothetical protein
MSTPRKYVGPVRPNPEYRWDQWCGTDAEAHRSAEWRAGFNHAMRTVALWLDFQVSCLHPDVVSELRRGPGLSSIGMYKSNLLGRLMRGEEVRRRPCATHQGRLSNLILESEAAAYACCDGTGWLPNRRDGATSEEDELWDRHRLTHPTPGSYWDDIPPNGAP